MQTAERLVEQYVIRIESVDLFGQCIGELNGGNFSVLQIYTGYERSRENGSSEERKQR